MSVNLAPKRVWDYGPLRMNHRRHEIMGVDSIGECQLCGRRWKVFGMSRQENRNKLRAKYRDHISWAPGEMDIHTPRERRGGKRRNG